jgi:hypothetical protein
MRAIEAIFILLILIGLCAGCTGFYYLCNSYAVEQAVGNLTNSVVNLVEQVALGLFYILVGVAIAVFVAGLGFAAKAGAESVGKAAILLMAAPAVRGAIEKGQTTRLPGPFTIERPQSTPYEFEQPQIEAPMRTSHLLQRRHYGQNNIEGRIEDDGNYSQGNHQL